MPVSLFSTAAGFVAPASAPQRAEWDYGGMRAADLGLRLDSFDDISARGEWDAPMGYGVNENTGAPISSFAQVRPDGSAYAFDDRNGVRWTVDNNGMIVPGSHQSMRSNEDFGNLVLAAIGTMAGAGLAGAGAGGSAAAAGEAAGAAGGAGGAAGASTGAGVGAGSASSGALTQMASTAARNALINGTMSELRGGNFADGARAGALSGVAAPIGAGVTSWGAGQGLGAAGSAALGGAAAGAVGAGLRPGASSEDIFSGALSGGAGGGANVAAGGGALGQLAGRAASGTVGGMARGQNFDDAALLALTRAATNPSSYFGIASRGDAGGGDVTRQGAGGEDSSMFDDYYGATGDPYNSDPGMAETDPFAGLAPGYGYGGEDYSGLGGSGDGGDPFAGFDPNEFAGAPGGATGDPMLGGGGSGGQGSGSPLDSIGGWLQQLWQGNNQTRGQANMILGLLGLAQSMRGGSRGGGAQTPAQLQSLMPQQNNTWSAAQQAAAQRFFTSPLTQLAQPSGASALQRYGVDPMAPKYADGGEVDLPPRRAGDPVVGTRGPVRAPRGVSPSREAALASVVQAASAPPRTVGGVARPNDPNTAPRVTVERLRRAEMYAEGGEVGGPLEQMAAMHEGPGFVSSGEGGGQDDMVQAALSPGEYVFDADVVSALGDGSNEEGARRLDEMRERIRAHNRSAPPTQIPPKARPPEEYLMGDQ